MGTALYRIHRATRSPWFFDASGAGRFDPVGAPGRGTSYWALSPLGAWVEVFCSRMLLTEEDISDRRLTVASLTGPLVVADLAVARALKSGVTAATTSAGDYSASQELAREVQGAERAIRWRLRHDLRGKSFGLALFGSLGDAAPAGIETSEAEALPAILIERAVSAFGYEILPSPPR